MRIGRFEVFVRQQKDGSWRYDIVDAQFERIEHFGFRPTEHAARDAGWDDAQIMRAFPRAG